MNTILNFEFNSIRNITCPDDKIGGRSVYVGKASLTSFLDIPDDDNVREYLVEAPGKKRATPSKVHLRIRETLRERPQDFCVLNNGVTIIARKIDIEDSKNLARLTSPSIINGSQTQGELARFHRANPDQKVYVTFEIVVCDDDGLIADISIARNFQNDVAALSIAGRLGQFDALEERLRGVDEAVKLKKSETDRSEEFLDSEKLVQVLTALIPNELWPKGEEPVKTVAYSSKAQCLKQFSDVHERANNEEKKDEKARALYEFYLDIAPDAWRLYKTWKTNRAFRGSGLRSIERDANGDIVEVPDGIVFPIIAAYSVFVAKTSDGWRLQPPSTLEDSELVDTAKIAYMQIANSNPGTMGKNRACYSQLLQYTSLLKRLSPLR